MYLEISPRQSGKTERIIQTAYECAMRNVSCIIFVPQYNMIPMIRRRLEKLHEYYNKEYYTSKMNTFMSVEILQATIHELHGRNFEKSWLLFDEFDYMTNMDFWQFLTVHSKDLYKGGFYTTPRFIRPMKIVNVPVAISKDPLIHLLQQNSYKCATHDSLNKSNIGNLFSTMSIEQFQMECLGTFIKQGEDTNE